MSNESQGLVKGEAALLQSPSVSASAQALPLSPSTSKTPELPGTLFICLPLSAYLSVSALCDLLTCLPVR